MRKLTRRNALDGYVHCNAIPGGVLVYESDAGVANVYRPQDGDTGYLVSVYASGDRSGHYWAPNLRSARRLGKKVLAIAADGYRIDGSPTPR